MNKILLLTLLVVATASLSFAAVSYKVNGTQVGTAEAINVLPGHSGINWNFDGFTLTANGVNWTDIKSMASVGGDHSGINWTSMGI